MFTYLQTFLNEQGIHLEVVKVPIFSIWKNDIEIKSLIYICVYVLGSCILWKVVQAQVQKKTRKAGANKAVNKPIKPKEKSEAAKARDEAR